MTKSVKEKTRIAKIKECKSLGIPVPSECFKFSVSVIKRKLDKNVNQRLERLKVAIDNPSWSIKPCTDFIKQNIEDIVLNGLRHLDIYEFKIKFYSYYIIEDKKVNICIKFIVKNKILGIIMSEEAENNIHIWNSQHIDYPEIFVSEEQKLLQKDKILSSIIFNIDLKNISIYKKFPFYKQMIEVQSKYDRFLDDTKLNIQNFFPSDLGFYADKQKFSFSHYNADCSEHYYYPPIDDFTELDIVKMLLHFKIIELHVEEDEFIMDNLSEIKNIIKISNY